MEQFMGFDDEKQVREKLSQVRKEMAERAKRITEAKLAKSEREQTEKEEKEYRLKHADVLAYEFAMFNASKILQKAVEKKMVTRKVSDWVIKELIRVEGNSLQKLREHLGHGRWLHE